MTITLNQAIPSKTVKILTESGPTNVITTDYFKGKTIVLVGVPGAFTPVCTEQHIPAYGALAAQLTGKGVDQIACLAVNDPFVLKAWAASMGVTDTVQMIADWDAGFTKALGLDIDVSVAGLGIRTKRFAMIVKDGIVVDLQVEESPGQCTVSSADAILNRLKEMAA